MQDLNQLSGWQSRKLLTFEWYWAKDRDIRGVRVSSGKFTEAEEKSRYVGFAVSVLLFCQEKDLSYKEMLSMR